MAKKNGQGAIEDTTLETAETIDDTGATEDTTLETTLPLTVDVGQVACRLKPDAPVANLNVAGVLINRDTIGVIPLGEFQRLAEKYGLEEVIG